MSRKLFGMFSGTHLTFMAVAGILAPSAIWAAAAYTNVVVQDPNGQQARVTPAGRLNVTDTVTEYAQTPSNYVRVFFFSSNRCAAVYTVPAGKALVISTISAIVTRNPQGTLAQVALHGGSTCTNANVIGYEVTDAPVADLARQAGAGVALPAGTVVSSQFTGSNQAVSGGQFYGYLVPASAVPAAATAEAEAMHGPVVANGASPASAGR